MQVGDDGAARLDAPDPGQRLADAEVAGMPGIAQPVDDPEFEVFERGPALGRNVVEVGRVSGLANAIAERGNVAVPHHEGRQRQWPTLPFDGAAIAGFDRTPVEYRGIVVAF